MWIALLVAAALGADVEGWTTPPPTGDLRDPLTATSPWLLPAGTTSGELLLDAPWRPLVAGEAPTGCTDCATTWDLPVVAGLLGGQLAAAWAPSGRLAVGVTARARAFTVGADDPAAPTADPATSGPSLSDLRLWVPVGVVPGDAFALSVTTHLDLPVSDVAALRARPFGGGLRVAAGVRGQAVQAQLEAGVEAHGEPDDIAIAGPIGWSARAGAGWTPVRGAGLIAELEARHAADGAPVGAEARLAARLGTGRLHGTVGVGLPLTAAPTIPAVRGLVSLRWVPPPVEAPVGHAATVQLVVTDAGGAALTPIVDVDGVVGSVRSVRGGAWALPVAPGTHEIGVAAEGFGRQARRVEVGGDGQIRWTTTLLPAAGDAVAVFDVRDPGDRAVTDAVITVDGVTLGPVGVDGRLTVGGLDPARALQLRAEASGLLPMSGPVTRAVDETGPIYLDRPAGQVVVRVRATGRPATDAALRVLGPETLKVPPLDAAGEAWLTLPPGDWIVVVSSPAHGLQQRTVAIAEGDRTLTEVVIDLRPPAGDARLRAELRDPDGRPVPEATLWLDEVPLAATSSGGVLVVEGLAPLRGTLRAEAPGMRPTEAIAVDLSAGAADVIVPMRWKPGTVRVVARSAEGPVPDALVRFAGPTTPAPLPLGPDGRLETTLEPGTWTAVVSAPRLGVQAREILVEPDRTSLIVVEAVLGAAESGAASLELRVADPNGAPVEGARVFVDGADRGTTSAGGHLRLEGLGAGARAVRIDSALHAPWERSQVGPGQTAVRLDWRRGLVDVVARAGDAPVDALIRAVGPAPLPPLALGPGGHRRLALPAGAWTVVGADVRLGLQSADVVVAPSTTQARVELRFAAAGEPAAIASLPLRDVWIRTIRQTTGEPVGAAVRVYGAEAMAQQDTGEAGAIVVQLRPGAWTAIASAQKLGLAQRDFVVPWMEPPTPVALELGAATLVERDGVLRFVEEIRFATGEARVLDDSRAMLDDVARTLRVRPSLRKVEIQGHTDDVGGADANLALSQRRAEAVRDALIAAGISPTRLVAAGYGSTRPKEDNATEAGRAANRRVELHILEVVDGSLP